jgi:hypothetical protein
MGKKENKYKQRKPKRQEQEGDSSVSPRSFIAEGEDTQMDAEHPRNPAGKPQTDQKKTWGARAWKWIKQDTTFANWCIVFFTAILAASSIYQFSVMRGQLDQMQDNSRPYIISMLPKYSEIPVADFHQIKLTPFYINVGTGPALNVSPSQPEIAIDADSGVVDRVNKYTFDYPPSSGDFLAPTTGQNQIVNALVTVETRFIQDKEREFILQGKEHVILFGGIKYSGMRGGNYETTYCYILNGQSIGNKNILPWSPCPCQRMK